MYLYEEPTEPEVPCAPNIGLNPAWWLKPPKKT